MNKEKLKIHLITLPRHFALPFFGGSALVGSLLAGGTISELNSWLGFIAVMFLMWSGHAANSFWDWKAGLDAPEEGSVAKEYTAGCRPIPDGLCSPKEVIINLSIFAILGLIVCGVIAARVGPYIFIPAVIGLVIPYLYTRGKFSWYQETALAVGVMIAAVLGMFAVNPNPVWWRGFIAFFPPAILLSYCLALDEYPDAEANLKKGVKSTAYKVWEYKFDLAVYLLIWLTVAYSFQVFLIAIGIFKPLTMISLILFPAFVSQAVEIKKVADDLREGASGDAFGKVVMQYMLVMMAYPILIVIGQIFG